jgi:GT2 family glycosyltransferase
MTDCAIIIVTLNTWGHLYRCLDALQRQTVQEFRVIIIDNGTSTDEQIRQLSDYKRATYVRNEFNVGFAAANNQALKLVDDCEWVVILNPDTVPEVGWFAALMAAARNQPQFSMFGSRLLKATNPSLLDGDGDRYHICGLPWRNSHDFPVDRGAKEAHEVFSPCAAAALYNRKALVSVGGFDEDFFCYAEDVDLGFRLRLAGYRCQQITDARVLHVGSATVGRRSDFYIFHGHRNVVWAYVKNMPTPVLWLFLPLHLGLNLFSLLWFTARGQGEVIFRSKIAALHGLKKMWFKRQLIQKQRICSISHLLRVMDKHVIPGIGRSLRSILK